MSIFDRLFRSKKEPITDADFARMLSGESWTGKDVDRTTAMGISATWAAVRLLADSVASLPLVFYKRTDKGKEKASGDPLFALLGRKPNPEQTSFSFRETLQHHLLLRGNAYARKVRNGAGRVMELWPLDAEKVHVERSKDSGLLRYFYKRNTGDEVLLPEEILHIPGLGWDGISGYAPLEIAVQEFGHSIAVKEYGSEFFKNDGTPGGYLQLPHRLKDKEAIDRLKKSWGNAHSNWGTKHSIGVLEDGAEFKQMSLPPEHMQFIASKKLSVTDIARIFRVPPHMIGDLERATFSNIEQQGIDFVVNSLRPWLVRWEQNLNNQIIPEGMQEDYFYEFNVNALLRGDVVARSQAYRTFIEMGVMTQNEVRTLENFNTEAGLDDHWVPLNWQKIEDSDLDDSTEPGFPQEPEDNSRMIDGTETRETRAAKARFKLTNSFKPLFEDGIGKIVRKEARDIRAAANKLLVRGNKEFDLFLDEFYDGLPEYIRKQVSPIFRTFADSVKTEVARELGSDGDLTPEDEEFITSVVDVFVKRYIGKSRADLRKAKDRAVSEGEEIAVEIVAQLEHWEEGRAATVAGNEAARGGNAFAKTFMIAAGVTYLRWVSVGKSCPFCDSLDGVVVGVEQKFALPNDVLQAEGDKMGVNSVIGHPPIHRGCDCQIVSGG